MHQITITINTNNMRRIIFKNAWFNFKNQSNLTFAQQLVNAWTNYKIEKLQLAIDSKKNMHFSFYKDETFKINELKKRIVKVQYQFSEDVMDFVMF